MSTGFTIIKGPVSDSFREEVIQRIECALSNGITRYAACASVGIGKSTLYELLAKRPDYADRLARADLAFRAKVEQKFGNDAMESTDWRARAEYLKRRYPETWGDRLDLRKVDDDTLRRIYTLHAETEEVIDVEYAEVASLPVSA